MSHNKILQTDVLKSLENKFLKQSDYIAVETPLEIRLGYDSDSFQSLAITMCSPDDINDLIFGYLFTENIIQKADDISEINVYDNEMGLIVEVILIKSIAYNNFLNKRHGMVHASCGICGKTEFDELLTYKYPHNQSNKNRIAGEIIQSLPQQLSNHQQGFTKTGGLHASALFTDKGDLMTVKEDIGRHNALDKLIGSALQKKLLPLKDHVILLSGRVSFELVHKSLMAGATALAAIGAPSSLSVEIAKVNKLDLFGFVKPSGFNQY